MTSGHAEIIAHLGYPTREDAPKGHNPARRIKSIRRTSNPRTKIDLAVR
jgi:hypothetical protein